MTIDRNQFTTKKKTSLSLINTSDEDGDPHLVPFGSPPVLGSFFHIAAAEVLQRRDL